MPSDLSKLFKIKDYIFYQDQRRGDFDPAAQIDEWLYLAQMRNMDFRIFMEGENPEKASPMFHVTPESSAEALYELLEHTLITRYAGLVDESNAANRHYEAVDLMDHYYYAWQMIESGGHSEPMHILASLVILHELESLHFDDRILGDEAGKIDFDIFSVNTLALSANLNFMGYQVPDEKKVPDLSEPDAAARYIIGTVLGNIRKDIDTPFSYIVPPNMLAHSKSLLREAGLYDKLVKSEVEYKARQNRAKKKRPGSPGSQ